MASNGMVVDLDSPDKASTIEDFIAAGSGTPTITWYNFSMLQVETTTDGMIDIHFDIDNILNDYLDLLDKASFKVTMTQQEQNKYFYNPELLAFDLYGSIELDFVILKMNGIIDPKDFDMPTIKLIKKTDLIEILSNIYNAESRFMNRNRKANGLVSLLD